MQRLELNDELLSAFLDGQLEEPTRLAVEQALAGDPGARVRLERMRHADALLRAAIPELPAPPGDPLAARIERGAALPARRSPALKAVAACLLAALCGVLIGRWTQRAPDPWVDAAGMIGGTLLQALEERASGERDSNVQVILSTQLRDGRFCRQFAIDARPGGGEGVACRNRGSRRWQLLGWDGAVQGNDGFRPAAGSELLDVMLDRLGAGEALTVDRERVLLERRWWEVQR